MRAKAELEQAAQATSDLAIEMEHCADVLYNRDDCEEEHPEFCESIADFLMAEAEQRWTICAGLWAQAKHRGGILEERGLAKPDHSD